jgi:cytochrome c peroxidase
MSQKIQNGMRVASQLLVLIVASFMTPSTQAATVAPTSTGHMTTKSPVLFQDYTALMKSATPKARLGQALFFDTNLSNPGGQACASCHAPGAGFTDPDKSQPVSKGIISGRLGNRNSPSAAYAAFSPIFQFDEVEGIYFGGQFWDGRAKNLEEQAKGPFLNPLEMNNTSKAMVIEKVRATYKDQFEYVYGKGALDDVEQAYNYLVNAIAAVEETPAASPFTSKFDAVMAGKVQATPQEILGFNVFMNPNIGNCAACHSATGSANGTPALFTDFTYDNLGVPRNPYNPFYLLKEFNPLGNNWVDIGLGQTVNSASENGKFKVPTLRNIALTAPYMHNGYFKDLKSVVQFYNTRDTKQVCSSKFTTIESAVNKNCWPVAEVPENVNHTELGNLNLTNEEVDALVVFMEALTDGYPQ